MAFEQKYDAATREAATARVLRRLATNPKDRHVFTVVADEFSVGQQSLRAWVAAAKPAIDQPSRKKPRPRFSPVVTTKAEQPDTPAQSPSEERPEVPEPAQSDTGSDTPASEPVPARPAAAEPSPAARPGAVADLEAEAAALRDGNESLKAAMRVLLEG